MRAYFYVALLLLLLFGGISGYLYNTFSTLASMDFTPPPVRVAVATAREETWPSTLAAVGSIRATRGVNLAAETSGEIINISVNSGEQVVAGQLLLTLNDSVEQASLRRARANLVLARQLFERDASLIRQQSIPQSQLDRSRADLDVAIASLAEIEAQLDNKRIVAPFAGSVGIIDVKRGDYIENGTAITTLQDLRELEIDFSVPARHFPSLRKGLPITVRTASSDRSYAAILEAVDVAVDPGTRNLALRAALQESDGLLPGMFAELRIDLQQPRQVITLPETAVSYSLQGDTVFAVEEDADGLLVNPRVVKTGVVRDGRIAISSGVMVGDRIASVGQNKLYRGARIVAEDNPPAFTQ
ncbi:efflux RND transporter periplasmic adaptor subunit [Pseudohalioglobus lutimaris]|uniref:Efflux transporter periplasmic adaptor subunit n=1 Tax=Pseudohalioglobus lutimaris TaxID=1737061 RepID=A0A2N5X6K8_9GAMM|nr:efflux RND transporter periplasmic adaptor subunit [Pseudohalioglobus lutimaris]PLW70124.1 efflux transporter periplasmic adaptor subunit [Pseudohalioglobus lutimaris]